MCLLLAPETPGVGGTLPAVPLTGQHCGSNIRAATVGVITAPVHPYVCFALLHMLSHWTCAKE